MPALPLDEAGKYVAAAFIVFFTLVFIYVAIMAAKLTRIERDLIELAASQSPETGDDRTATAAVNTGRIGDTEPAVTAQTDA